jgi:hypothetical protein
MVDFRTVLGRAGLGSSKIGGSSGPSGPTSKKPGLQKDLAAPGGGTTGTTHENGVVPPSGAEILPLKQSLTQSGTTGTTEIRPSREILVGCPEDESFAITVGRAPARYDGIRPIAAALWTR